jgi:hypothetical protein
MADKTMVLKRTTLTANSTVGELYMPDGSFQCFVLEDVLRKFKVPEKTAIPSGTYEVAVIWSNRMGKPMPRLLEVPFFDGILIHPGNTAVDTFGCLLVGRKKGEDAVLESVLAFEDIFPKIRKMVGEGKLFIEIQGGYPADEWDMMVGQEG